VEHVKEFGDFFKLRKTSQSPATLKQRYLEVSFRLALCDGYNQNPLVCFDSNCNRLHLCKKLLKSTCSIVEHDRTCSHTLFSEQNQNALVKLSFSPDKNLLLDLYKVKILN
jgi:hypothetical protein